MSRNKEKAQSALNRFQQYKNQQAGVLESNPLLRPTYVQKVDSLPQAEKWRSVVMTEISVRLTRIQDPTLSDFQLRELNDELNKLFREKRAWEYHIKSLGGNDYLLLGGLLQATGLLVNDPENTIKGYRYFGRAKELPDVVKLLKNEEVEKPIEKIEKPKEFDPLYYGFDDVKISTKIYSLDEIDSIKKISEKFNEEIDLGESEEEDEDELLEFERRRGGELLQQLKRDDKKVVVDEIPQNLPSNTDVNQWLVDRKKKELMNRLGMNNAQK